MGFACEVVSFLSNCIEFEKVFCLKAQNWTRNHVDLSLNSH